MNNKKILSAAILLILAKSALGIEVEPNNNSAQANKLGKENFGQLKNNSDVDFFSIDTSGERGDKEISLSFSCDSHASASGRNDIGWYIGIYSSNGENQASYQIKPEDCLTGASNSKGPYSFKFYSDTNSLIYYLSVVGDCETSATLKGKTISVAPCTKSNSATYSIKVKQMNPSPNP